MQQNEDFNPNQIDTGGAAPLEANDPRLESASLVQRQLQSLGFNVKRDASDPALSFLIGVRDGDVEGTVTDPIKAGLGVREERKRMEALLEEFYQTNSTPANVRLRTVEHRALWLRNPGFRLECNPADPHLAWHLKEFAQFLETKDKGDLVSSRARQVHESLSRIFPL